MADFLIFRQKCRKNVSTDGQKPPESPLNGFCASEKFFRSPLEAPHRRWRQVPQIRESPPRRRRPGPGRRNASSPRRPPIFGAVRFPPPNSPNAAPFRPESVRQAPKRRLARIFPLKSPQTGRFEVPRRKKPRALPRQGSFPRFSGRLERLFVRFRPLKTPFAAFLPAFPALFQPPDARLRPFPHCGISSKAPRLFRSTLESGPNRPRRSAAWSKTAIKRKYAKNGVLFDSERPKRLVGAGDTAPFPIRSAGVRRVKNPDFGRFPDIPVTNHEMDWLRWTKFTPQINSFAKKSQRLAKKREKSAFFKIPPQFRAIFRRSKRRSKCRPKCRTVQKERRFPAPAGRDTLIPPLFSGPSFR